MSKIYRLSERGKRKCNKYEVNRNLLYEIQVCENASFKQASNTQEHLFFTICYLQH